MYKKKPMKRLMGGVNQCIMEAGIVDFSARGFSFSYYTTIPQLPGEALCPVSGCLGSQPSFSDAAKSESHVLF